MDRNVALAILSALADGCDPETGEVFPPEHVLQQPAVIRALGLAVTLMRESDSRWRREPQESGKPPRGGTPWTEKEDKELQLDFDQDVAIGVLASKHGRTPGAIRSRLVKHGRLSQDSIGSAVASTEPNRRVEGE